MAKQNRPKEKVELLFVSPQVQVSRGAAAQPMIQIVYDLARGRQVSIYLVGGSVRDLLLGTETHDLDFAVDGDGLAFARYVADELRGAYVALDRERKTGRVILLPESDVQASARPLSMDFASLRGPDLDADLADRDFTMNAMALERTAEGRFRLVDPLDGSDDLAKGVLRAASPASFLHDPVRTLRAVRMHVQFGCVIEPETRAWLLASGPRLGTVSAERIRDEWFKILQQRDAALALREAHRLGLLRVIAPPVARLDGLSQSAPHRFDVLSHAFETVRAIEQVWDALQEQMWQTQVRIPDVLRTFAPQVRQRYTTRICDERTYLALLKCAALLHDVGKAEAHTADGEGKVRFIGHERIGSRIARDLARDWRCSNVEGDMLCVTVEAHMRPTWLAQQPSLTRRAIYRFFRDTGEYGVDAAIIALADYLATWGPNLPAEGWQKQVETVARLWRAYFEQKEMVIEPPLLLSGHDLIDLGISPGPRIGELLARVREAQAVGEVETRQDALARVKEWLATSPPSNG